MTEPITEQLGSDELLENGQRKLEWARQHMPIMAALREDFAAEQPFAGERIGMAMHVEAKTAILTELLAIGGAEVAITGC
ncbi:adenosylhomocysteinase, partial [Halobacteriales archaeon SW_10_66_29]